MDPVGPWSAYASYNRLAGVQAGASGADLHHHLTSAGTPVTTTAQILSSGFLSPPHVGYDTVFSPLFHPGSAKPSAHYVTQVQQHRQALAQAANAKQTNEGDYHQAQAFFEQNASAWPQNSPFGILPHESVVPSTTSGKSTTASYENFNAHFVAAQGINHLNSPLAVVNSKNSSRAQSPHISNTVSAKSPATQPNSANFFQSSSSTYASGNSSDASNNNKPFAPSNSSNLQQSCIVSSSPNSSAASKDYHRVPQSRTIYLGSPNPSRPTDKQSFTAPQTKQLPQIQTKAQTKIYPELSNHVERQRQAQQNEDNSSQSSPISFSLMDAAGRISYAGSNSSAKRSQFQHSAGYRHYQSGNNSDSDFQRSKGGSDYSNGPDCNVVVPRRPSPLQAHSQASPLGHVPSPAYPMYNSPLNSISSPQNSNIVTPPSPLDVTVARTNAPQTTGNVAYPSVITRALNSNHNTNQSCWDEQRQQQQRKFIGQSNNANNYNSNSEVASRQVTNERQQQQAYFESGQHQVSLQDLSSCRGDPMSIVKNLQQQSCQVQQSEIKQEIKSTAKRRKSNENKINNASVNDVVAGPNIAEYFSGRIPPPAHAATTNQPQQNGAYFDFENRWAPPSSSKIFGTQAAIHQQHQGLMVPHPHSHHPPPLPYFPPFHLAPHPNEFASAELAPIASYSEQPSQAASSSQFTQQESSPKVIVPNIEEELNFLSGGNHAPSTAVVTASTAVRRTSTTNQIIQPSKPSDKGPNTGSSDGFMNSYLKFLNGERNNSPPPPARGNRKQTWSRAKPMQQQPQQPPLPQPGPNLAAKPDGLSSSSSVPLTPPPSLQVVTTPPVRPTIGDPQDDPRYFPLPKERKQNIFDSSDDGFTSDEDLFARKVTPVVKVEPPPKEKTKKKGRPSKGVGSAERKRSRDIPSYVKTQEENGNRDSPKLPPRRESSKRAAKEKTSMQQLMKQTVDDDLDEPIEFMDSDSDPAWTPQAREDLEEEITMKKSKKLGIRGRKRKNVTSYGSEFDEYSNDSQSGKKAKLPSGNKQVQKQNNAPTLEDNIAAAVAQQNNGPHNLSEDNLFKDGEFVALKSELGQEWPVIWRVDNVNLLQKFESFEQNGQTLYRNGSSAWAPENKKYYVNVPIKFIMQGQSEVIVELLRNEMIFIDHEFVKQAMKESEGYQDNFEVYIQTLISQALDSNFLTEIFQEQDEYFLTNVKTIDDITDTKKYKMINLLRWPNPVEIAVTTWPCLNVIRELGAADTQFHPCAACMKPGVAVRVLMYGQPYNSTTLEGCQPSTQFIEKDFLMCRICASHVELFNKITHQKYLMYIECAKRVAEKRTTDPNKDTTCILNELLADEQWLNQLFYDVRGSWAEVDNFEYSFKFKSVIQ